jgi:hypothetical protein
MVRNGCTSAHIVPDFSRSMLAPPVGLGDLSNDNHAKVTSAVGYECLDNEAFGGVKPRVVKNRQVPKQLIAIFCQKDRPSAAPSVAFQNQWKRL